MALLYRKEGKIAYLTINRPEAFNAMDPPTLRELSEALVDFRDDPALWVAIVTGAGEKAFCSGADLKTMVPYMYQMRGKSEQIPATPMRGMEIWKPLIAAINGACLGGGLEIALGCDLRIASENATLGTPEVKVGLMPGWGGTQRLPRFIPMAKAAELLLTGQIINAQEAYRIGLLNQVVPLTELMATAKQWADKICEAGPLGVRAAKEAMIKGSSVSLEEGLQIELKLFEPLFDTEDHQEGVKSFVERRKPQFKAK